VLLTLVLVLVAFLPSVLFVISINTQSLPAEFWAANPAILAIGVMEFYAVQFRKSFCLSHKSQPAAQEIVLLIFSALALNSAVALAAISDNAITPGLQSYSTSADYSKVIIGLVYTVVVFILLYTSRLGNIYRAASVKLKSHAIHILMFSIGGILVGGSIILIRYMLGDANIQYLHLLWLDGMAFSLGYIGLVVSAYTYSYFYPCTESAVWQK